MVHLSEVDADKWQPLLCQVNAAREGAQRTAEPAVVVGCDRAVSKLTQHQRRLTEEEIASLVADYRAGSTVLELAVRLGCDRKTVIRYLKLNCVETRYRKLTEAQIDEIVGLFESGWSLAAIGRRFSVDPKTIKARLWTRGMTAGR